ncbi:histidine kinase [Chitinophaga niabensis]|uniref:sensor histidine kinase n=1 Tax=Chitinophaga niabensis TaxID=536979 RepID=UPI0031BA3D72
MKRVLLHVLFWVAYTLQDALMEYTWTASSLPGITEKARFLMATHAAVAATLPKLILTYFILYAAIPQILKGTRHIAWVVLQTALMLCITLALYRMVFNYYIFPVIYDNVIKTAPLFKLSRLLLGVMDMGFVSATAVAFKLIRMQLSAKEREKNLVKEKLETELKYLRNQTNPHFLFNTLNNIYALARKKSDLTPEIVMKLSKLLRFMLYESGKGRITLAEEMKMMDDYLELEKIRYNNRLNIVFKKDIDNELYPVSPLLLLPFVENAFKHGVSETRFDSYIHMEIRLHQGLLTFIIENNKENESQGSKDKIGLENVRRQLELMYKEHQLLVFNEPAVFKVVLTINLDSHAKI